MKIYSPKEYKKKIAEENNKKKREWLKEMEDDLFNVLNLYAKNKKDKGSNS